MKDSTDSPPLFPKTLLWIIVISTISIILLFVWVLFPGSLGESNETPPLPQAQKQPIGNPPLCHIIAIGDSITAGYNLDPKDAFPAKLETMLRENGYPCTVVNGGVSGDTSKGLLDRLDFTLGDDAYNLAILTIGGNDGLRQLPLTDLQKNINEIIAKIKKKNIPILLTGMQIPNNGGSYAKEFRAIFPEIAKKESLPFYPFFLE